MRVALVVLVGVVASGGCRRRAAPIAAVANGTAPGTPVAGGAATPRRPGARQEPFSHPLLAGATTRVTRENCSRSALASVVERALVLEGQADPGAGHPRSKRPGSGDCPSAAADETEKMVRAELLPRVGGCVARDGPLDPEWDMVQSAVLAIGVCLDCRRGHDERATQCRRAREVLGRVAKTPR